MVRVKGALLRPDGGAREERLHVSGPAAVDRDDRRRVPHRPVHERGRVRGPRQHASVALAARVGERARQRGEPAAKERDAAPRKQARRGHRQRLERLRLAQGRLAIALEGVEQGLDEEPLLDRRVPRGAAHGALERAPRRPRSTRTTRTPSP